MTKYAISLTLLATLALAGCKSAQQKAEDIEKEYRAANDQYVKDCPEFESKPVFGLFDGFDKLTPAQIAAYQNEEKARQANLSSPHCTQLREKRNALFDKMVAAAQAMKQ
jgi:hypothetical protein